MTAATEQPDGWEKVCCPKCHCDESRILCQGRDYLYHVPGEYFASECIKCGFCFQNPRPTADRLVDLYPSGYAPHATKERLPAQADHAETPPARIRHADFLARRLGYSHLVNAEKSGITRLVAKLSDRKRGWKHGVALTPTFVPTGRVLEIGCGNGSKLQQLGQLGWKHLSGIELVPEAAEEARAKGITVECGMVEDVLAQYPDGHFDVILSSMVMEHLYDPFEVVRQVAAKLKPGGEFLFSTICRDSLDAKLFGAYWAGFDFPRHMVYFRVQDIRDMLADSFDGVECFHQIAPIDFVRSASWRNRPWDRVVGALAKSPLGKPFCAALVRMGWTTRVSFRCRRRQHAADAVTANHQKHAA